MSKYAVKHGAIFKIADIDEVAPKLPKGTYNLSFDGMTSSYYLEQTSNLEVPKKIYGDLSLIDRVIKVYKHKDRNVGLLLYGLKGSGKTLAMRALAQKLDQPVIIINESFGDYATEAIKFLSDEALGDCTILIDEYEKKFDVRDDAPLALLDGPYSTHHFFILTANESRINENMQNRPGRVYYNVNYSGLTDDVIEAVAKDMLQDQNQFDELIEVCEELPNLSFDMLISLINDMNLFHESAKKAVKWFGFTREAQYVTVYQKINGKLSAQPIIDSMYFDQSRRSHSEWVEVQLTPNSTQKESMYLNLINLEKVSKNIYTVTDYIIPDEIRDAENKKSKDAIKAKLQAQGAIFEPNSYRIKLDFELHMNSTPKINYIY